jgi:hypothetical protein
MNTIGEGRNSAAGYSPWDGGAGLLPRGLGGECGLGYRPVFLFAFLFTSRGGGRVPLTTRGRPDDQPLVSFWFVHVLTYTELWFPITRTPSIRLLETSPSRPCHSLYGGTHALFVHLITTIAEHIYIPPTSPHAALVLDITISHPHLNHHDSTLVPQAQPRLRIQASLNPTATTTRSSPPTGRNAISSVWLNSTSAGTPCARRGRAWRGCMLC